MREAVSEVAAGERFAVAVRRAEGRQRERLVVHRTIALRWTASARELEVAGRHFFATVRRLDPGSVAADLWTCWEEPGELNDALSNFVRVVIALGWTPAWRPLLHSCAVVDPAGRASLFFGVSGAGKSTLGALAIAAGRRVLSDDLNAVDLGGSGPPRVQAFPWSGDHGPTSWTDVRAAELAAIFRLEKAPEHAITPLGRASAVAGLAACSPFINAEPALYGRLLPVLEDLVRRAPVFTLRFRKREDVWAVVDEATRRDR